MEPTGPVQRDRVLAELERVLNGAAFRGSRRSQDFLRHIVTNALGRHEEMLKERSIGAAVFGRPADYDTGDDSIVRVKASEVRKRLAQHYMEAGASAGVHIELPAGSYTPEFRFQDGAAVPAPARVSRRRVILSSSLGAALTLAGMYFLWPHQTALDRFWDPVLRSKQPVLLCVAHPVVYRLSGTASQAFRMPPEERPAEVPLAEITRDPDHYVGIGDTLAVAGLARFLERRGKPMQVRAGTDTSFTDLRNSPAVLIGAYSNQWTMQVANDLRYVFDWDGTRSLIRDRMDPNQRWAAETTGPLSDYVVISRLFDSRTGEVLITAAGIGHFGTQAAGEFLTNPAHMEQAVRGAPRDWHARNMQLVLRAEVIGRTPGPPKVVASWFW